MFRSLILIGCITTLLLVGCSSSTKNTTVSTLTPTSTLPPTATSTPTPQPIDPTALQKCGYTDLTNIYRGNHILLHVFAVPYYGVSYVQIPPGTSSKPYELQGSIRSNPPYDNSFVSLKSLLLPFDPDHLTMTLGFTWCSLDTQDESIQSMQVKLDQFLPSSDTLDAWRINCAGGEYYTRQQGVNPSSCGGQIAYDSYQATFTSSQPNTQVQVTSSSTPFIHPQGPDNNYIFMDGLADAGTYTFSLSYTDGQGVNHEIPFPLSIMRPHLSLWSGSSCLQADMQAQIPEDSTSRYICPPTA